MNPGFPHLRQRPQTIAIDDERLTFTSVTANGEINARIELIVHPRLVP